MADQVLADISFSPIGIIRTPFGDRLAAPRQPYASEGAEGTIELLPGKGFEHALEDLEGWDRLWLVFVFHLNASGGWKPKVLPPRSNVKRGVFSTRSPHRPNPIGISVVRLEQVRGLTLHVRDLDMIDGTPLLDLKPYVAYADAFPDAGSGWLGAPADPEPAFTVSFAELAREQVDWLLAQHGVDLAPDIGRILALGPTPHPYRRIRAEKGGFRLALRDFRVSFRVDGRAVTVDAIRTGYRPSQLAAPASPEVLVHQAFALRFG